MPVHRPGAGPTALSGNVETVFDDDTLRLARRTLHLSRAAEPAIAAIHQAG